MAIQVGQARFRLHFIVAHTYITIYYTDIFWMVNPYRAKNRNFLYNTPIEDIIQKFSVYFWITAIIFHDKILHIHIIQKDSEYRPMDKPPKKLLEQDCLSPHSRLLEELHH